MNTQIEIPVYPHLKKFIYKYFDIPEGQAVHINMNTSMGIAMKHVLKEKRHVIRSETERLTDRMKIVLSKHALAKMSTRMVILHNFNVEYDRIFKEHMMQWVKAQYHAGLSYSQSVKNFLNHYNIYEEEYSYNSAFRQFLRVKNKEAVHSRL